MIGGMVEVGEQGRHLSVDRGFLKVTTDGEEIGRVPLDDITALILSAHQVTLSKNLMVALAERRAIIVTCGRNWHPLSFTLPFGVHFDTAGILHDQIALSEPLRKRLWQVIVRAKIANQALALELVAGKHRALAELATLGRQVRSGDPDNREAQAARHYWPAMMGEGFRRDRGGDGYNACLNYGYTVLRAATARAVCGAGLHPALGLHHRSRINPFALIDDLMEPFRPMVDILVASLEPCDAPASDPALGPEQKRRMAAVLQADMITGQGVSPVVNCLARLAHSLVASLRHKTAALDIAGLRKPGHLV